MQPTLVDRTFRMAKPDPAEFNVLNHGDFWCNNMMFTHDTFGKLKDILFVDFQTPKYGTFAQDLYYFLLSSTKLEDKLLKFDYYVRVYHENLVKSLKLLKYESTVPSLRQTHVSLIKYSLFGKEYKTYFS